MTEREDLGPYTTYMDVEGVTYRLAYVAGPNLIAIPGTSVADTGALTSAAPAALTSAAPAALTSSQNATTNAATQTGSYVQADVQTIATLGNALKVSYNAAQADIAAIRTNQGLIEADVAAIRTNQGLIQADVAAIRTTLNALADSLRAAGVISP